MYPELHSEQTLLCTIVRKIMKDNKLMYDTTTQILNKCYQTYSANISSRMKGIRTGNIKYLKNLF